MKIQSKDLKKCLSFPDHSWDRFLWILERFWHQVGSQNGARIDIKGGWENDEKMMMTRIANKSDIGGYGCIRHHGFETRGGGRRRAKPLLQYSTKDWKTKRVEGWMLARKSETTCRPEGWWDYE